VIKTHDRSGWIGASDTARVMGNWETETFRQFWSEKLGYRVNNFKTTAMIAGTYYEHRILDAMRVATRDRQIRKPALRLRVNLDGETKKKIVEVKTYGKDVFKVSSAYWQQAQAEMFAAGKPLDIASNRLYPEDYDNFFNPIDKGRLSIFPIERDDVWIEQKYLPRLRVLAKCLQLRRFPDESEIVYGSG
jgi:hypothetical protein